MHVLRRTDGAGLRSNVALNLVGNSVAQMQASLDQHYFVLDVTMTTGPL